jgi:hypothetical protein
LVALRPQLYTPQVDELLEQHYTVLYCIYFFYKGSRSQLTMPDALKLLSDCELWNQEARCPTSQPFSLNSHASERLVRLSALACCGSARTQRSTAYLYPRTAGSTPGVTILSWHSAAQLFQRLSLRYRRYAAPFAWQHDSVV